MRFVFAIAVLFLCASPAAAQNIPPSQYNYFDYDRTWYVDPQYRDIVKAARNMGPGFGFDTLRRLYMQSSHYAPVGDEAARRLLQAFDRLEKSQDGEAVYKNLQEVNAILRDQLGNLSIVMIAESLSREDSRLGSPEFYAWLRAGLMRNVIESGDGSTPEDAYDVITLAEETELLKHLNLNALSMETIQGGIFVYNIYKIARPGEEPVSLFVNVTYPISKERKTVQRKERPLTIYRQ